MADTLLMQSRERIMNRLDWFIYSGFYVLGLVLIGLVIIPISILLS